MLIYKQRNKEIQCTIMLKKSITELNPLLFTLHAHKLLLISINQNRGYIFFSQFNNNRINMNINLKGHI